MVMYLGKVAEVGPVGGDLRRSAPSLHGGAAGLACRRWTRTSAPRRRRFRATRPTRSTRRPAAASTPAASMVTALVRPQPSPSSHDVGRRTSRGLPPRQSELRPSAAGGGVTMGDAMTATAPIVDVQRLTVDFGTGAKTVRAVGGRRSHARQGRDRCAARRIRLRQERHVARARCACTRSRRGSAARSRSTGATCSRLSARELARYRGGVVSMVFQDPGLAFDPVYRVGDQIAEAVVRHEGIVVPRGTRARARAVRARAHPLARSAGSTTIRTKCRAACASAP